MTDQNQEPELVCKQKELDINVEEDIKAGFFELKKKFASKDKDESSIYISHVVLKDKHPIFKKMEVETIKQMLSDSSIIYLA